MAKKKKGIKIKGLDKLEANLDNLSMKIDNIPKISVGVDSSSTYPSGELVEQVGYLIEFGSISNNTEPNSFIRSTLEKHATEYEEKFNATTKKVLAGDKKASKEYTKLGEEIVKDIQATVKEKAYDTGKLHDSITMEIE